MSAAVYHFQLRYSTQYVEFWREYGRLHAQKSNDPSYVVDMRYVSDEQLARMYRWVTERRKETRHFCSLKQREIKYSAHRVYFDHEEDQKAFVGAFHPEVAWPKWFFEVETSKVNEVAGLIGAKPHGIFPHLKQHLLCVMRVHDAAAAVAIKMLLSEGVGS